MNNIKRTSCTFPNDMRELYYNLHPEERLSAKLKKVFSFLNIKAKEKGDNEND
ncbi:MAG: hypothetical protein WC356_00335 [Candidatus Micrarchaeia archaeon]|jgi:hypothetical protein